MNNIILVDKPKGITSFDVIRKLRKKLGIKKMGHAGTLDPLASGLMIIGIYQGTKLLDQYLKLPKTYYAEILLGKSTDTGDLEGQILSTKKITEKIQESDIEEILRSLIGTQSFQVPIYSAIKVDGKPLYWYARQGIAPPRIPTKDMEIRTLSLLDSYKSDDFWVLNIRCDVGSGTYIRVLAEEIGKRIGYPATLRNLRRTQIGDFSIHDAQEIDEVCYNDEVMINTVWHGITINIKSTNTELSPALRDYIETKVTKLGQLLQKQEGDIFVYFDIAKLTQHHNKGDIYHADAKVRLAGKEFYASAEGEDYMIAIDKVKEKLYREIRNDKNKGQSLFRRGASRMKRLLRGS